MSLANFGALFWLIPLAGIIIILYLLKMRRKDLRVPATFLWPAMTYEIRANALFQRLRLSWLLFLQLLALSLVVFALAQPQVKSEGLAGEVTVIVLDTSASMGATDVKPTRFDEAQKVAESVVASAKAGDRVSLIEAGPTPRVVFPLSGDVPRMRRALASLKLTDADADVGEALRLAASLAAKQPSARIIFISDGVFPEVRNFSAGKAKVVFQKIGSSRENVAITAIGATDTPAGRQIYCGLKNYGSKKASGTLDLYADGKLFNSAKVSVDAGATKGETLPAPKGAKVVEAKLKIEDVLAADNYGVAVTDPGASVRVLLIGKGDMFLERALSLDPRVVLDRAAELPATEKAGSDGAPSYDVIIFEGAQEQAVKAPGVLTFGQAGASSPVTAQGTAQQPRFTVADSQHPLMASVDFRGVFIDRVERVKAKSQGEVVAETSAGPLLVVSRSPKRQIYVAFSPLESDFPLQVSFPILMANALDFLAPREAKSGALALQVGRTFSIPALGKEDELTVKSPDGDEETIKPSGGTYVVRSLRNVGRYTIDQAGQRRAIYASMTSDSESNVAPQERVLLGSADVGSTGSILRLADYWRPFLLLALMVLAGEWWLFARRS
jgi:Ca-activated chloride channel homolog